MTPGSWRHDPHRIQCKKSLFYSFTDSNDMLPHSADQLGAEKSLTELLK